MSNPDTLNQPIDPHEQERRSALTQVMENYLSPDDHEFLADIDEEDERIGYVYGRLLEQGEDPDTILKEYGVTEVEDEI